ncbi:MAG: hypothetical protein MJY96_10035 [Bacteroidaceae bacterium]|nr:hypothetical protein [Bacteroidaceae bacterium]
MEKNEMKEYHQPKVTVVNFKVERAIAQSYGCSVEGGTDIYGAGLCYD